MKQDIENRLKNRLINPTAMRLLVLDFLTKQIAAISLNDLELIVIQQPIVGNSIASIKVLSLLYNLRL